MKAFFFALFIIIGVNSFSQDSTQNRQQLKDEYLAKRKSNNTGGTVLLIGGLAAFTIAAANEVSNMNFDLTDPDAYEDSPKMTWLYVASGAMIAGAIACYITASKYKRKANSISFQFKMDKTEFLQKGLVSSKPLPSLSINIPLK